MPSIHDLTSRLGSDLVSCPEPLTSLDVRYQSVIIYDPLQMPAFGSGDLVLAVGVNARSTLAARLIAAGPAALMFRHDGPPPQSLLDEALGHDVVLLFTPSSCDWTSLYTIASSLPEATSPQQVSSSIGAEVISDLFAAANALALSLDAPVTIEDNQSRVLAFSATHHQTDAARAATILGLQVPGGFRQEVHRLGVSKRVLTETGPFFLTPDDPDIDSRTVVPLRAHGEVHGSIWAVTHTPLDAARTATLVDAARSIAIRLAHHRITTDLQGQQRVSTMTVLLRGGAAALGAARRAGMEEDGHRLVAVAAVRHDGSTDSRLLERYEIALRRQLSLLAGVATVAVIHETVYAVLPDASPSAASLLAMRRLLLESRAAARPDAPELVTIAISGHLDSLADVGEARDQTQRILQVLCVDPGHDGCAEVDDVGLAVSFLRLADFESARRAGRASPLDDVDAYDRKHSSHYGQTLRAYLDAFGDPAVVSQRLHIHTNTLRYRLRRLHENFGIDVTDPDTRFALMVEVKLKTFQPAA